MGYIIALIVLLLVVPLLFMMLSRRTTTSGRLGREPEGRGVTVEKPSSEEPTPSIDQSMKQPTPGAERRLPPG